LTAALALAGWTLAAALALRAARLSRRLDLIAHAEHELRGPVSALSLGVEALGRVPELRRRAAAFEAHLDRLRLGLAELDAARAGKRAPARTDEVAVEGVARATTQAWEPAARAAGAEISFEWHAGPVVARADRARLSQALGNVLANAVEHGGERIAVSGERDGGGVRITVRDRGEGKPREGAGVRLADVQSHGPDPYRSRGHGLTIAARGLDEMGGSLSAPDLGGVLSGSRRRDPRRGRKASNRCVRLAGRADRGPKETEVRLELPVVEGGAS
jgi:signal transduction histidine kinase